MYVYVYVYICVCVCVCVERERKKEREHKREKDRERGKDRERKEHRKKEKKREKGKKSPDSMIFLEFFFSSFLLFLCDSISYPFFSLPWVRLKNTGSRSGQVRSGRQRWLLLSGSGQVRDPHPWKHWATWITLWNASQ